MGVITLERRDNESLLDYHKRLVYGKLVDKTLADYDYTELSQYVYGKEYSADVARRLMYGSRYTLELMDEEGLDKVEDASALNKIDEQMIELRKERQKFFDQRSAFNKVIRDRSRQEELNEIITRVVSSGELPTLAYEHHYVEPSDNDLLVSLNDIHYGASYSNFWGEYNPDVCREMMRTYLDKIIQVAKLHNSENCYIWENGDAISGSIHKTIQISNKENVVDQIIGVSELIAEFIAELSKHFKSVGFVSVAGNHSRLDPNKENAPLDERLDDLVEWYLKSRLQNFENVTIGIGEKVDSTMYLLRVRGMNYAGVHGDLDGSASQIQSVQTMIGQPLYAVLSGHMHHNKVDVVQGIKTVMAGSFLGMDDFCLRKRIYGRPEQMICVCDSSGIVCHYDATLK